MESKACALQKSGLLFQGRHITKGVYPLFNFILCDGLETLNNMLETSVWFSCFRSQILWQQLWPWHVSSGVHWFVIIPDFICCTSRDFPVDIAKNVSVPTSLETHVLSGHLTLYTFCIVPQILKKPFPWNILNGMKKLNFILDPSRYCADLVILTPVVSFRTICFNLRTT